MSDPRETLSNGRVAHTSLRGQVDARTFAEGQLHRVTLPVADIRRDPEATKLERQMLFGEPFRVLEARDGHCFGRAEQSGYVGYVSESALAQAPAPTHRVIARQTFAFAAPDLKEPGPISLSLGSLGHVTERQGGFAHIAGAGWVPEPHLSEVDGVAANPVAIAERLLGVAYLWGGNTAFGIDCSGLVQLSLNACGLACPGDSDQQERALGRARHENTPPLRGDLMFWKGHVAWVSDAETLIHANAHHMAVAYEPITEARARIAALGDTPFHGHIRPRDIAKLQSQ